MSSFDTNVHPKLLPDIDQPLEVERKMSTSLFYLQIFSKTVGKLYIK